MTPRSGARHATLVLIVATLAWINAWNPTRAWGVDVPRILEDRVKAAYVYRFTEYAECQRAPLRGGIHR